MGREMSHGGMTRGWYGVEGGGAFLSTSVAQNTRRAIHPQLAQD